MNLAGTKASLTFKDVLKLMYPHANASDISHMADASLPVQPSALLIYSITDGSAGRRFVGAELLPLQQERVQGHVVCNKGASRECAFRDEVHKLDCLHHFRVDVGA